MSFAKTLLHGTAEVHKSLERCLPGAPREHHWLVKGLRVSCEVLGDLLIDPEFLRFVNGIYRVSNIDDGIRELDRYAKNRQLLQRFLESERELFIRAGLPESVTETMIRSCESIIIEGRFEVRSDMTQALSRLQSYVCSKASLFESTTRRAILLGVREAFGGLALSALNGGLLAASVGLSGAASAGSIAVGGVACGHGISRIDRFF